MQQLLKQPPIDDFMHFHWTVKQLPCKRHFFTIVQASYSFPVIRVCRFLLLQLS